jgi:hypothetical protein
MIVGVVPVIDITGLLTNIGFAPVKSAVIYFAPTPVHPFQLTEI